MRQPLFLISVVFLLLFSSCTKALIGSETTNKPSENFGALWQDFDEHYGAFVPKNINWKAAYDSLRPMVNDNMTDAQFFAVAKRLLNVLDDNHVYLRPTANTGLPWYAGGVLGRTFVQDYNKGVALAYLSTHTVYDNSLEYGTFSGNVGYIKILNFDNNISDYPKAMDAILNKLKDTKGIVIEMRENDGGEDRVAQYIANRFATERHLSFTASLRNGPRSTDFADPIQFYTKPEGDFQYTKPVMILTDLNTFSAGETFALAMLQNKNVKLVGDVTGGALSDAVHRELPNGWLYRMPIADVRDAYGKNLEGIGIQPHIKIKNTKAELDGGHDKALEKALEVLR
ncbi:MAG TPA: S41 family peptidase [Chitinophagaceae bacterium]|nr:S41 family peptidase [Chitinophagaceae bacterium]